MQTTWSLPLHPGEKEGQDALGGDAEERERQREKEWGRGWCSLDNAILVAMKRGLYVFFRDLKASSGRWGPGQGERMPLQSAGGGSRSESLYCLP